MATFSLQSGLHRHSTCTDHVVGAILSGWRYDISGISPHLRGDYEDHLHECAHCRGKQRLHRTVDMLLFAATTLSFAAFLLAAVVLHRLRAFNHLMSVHVHLLSESSLVGLSHSHIATGITVSLQAVAILGVFVSMLLWILVAIATPVPDMVSELLREKSHREATGVNPADRANDRLKKQAA